MKNKLKEYREHKNMTQKQLAEQCGISSRAVISIEKGEYNPCLLLAYRMSKVLESTMEDLFCLEENHMLER